MNTFWSSFWPAFRHSFKISFILSLTYWAAFLITSGVIAS